MGIRLGTGMQRISFLTASLVRCCNNDVSVKAQPYIRSVDDYNFDKNVAEEVFMHNLQKGDLKKRREMLCAKLCAFVVRVDMCPCRVTVSSFLIIHHLTNCQFVTYARYLYLNVTTQHCAHQKEWW